MFLKTAFLMLQAIKLLHSSFVTVYFSLGIVNKSSVPPTETRAEVETQISFAGAFLNFQSQPACHLQEGEKISNHHLHHHPSPPPRPPPTMGNFKKERNRRGRESESKPDAMSHIKVKGENFYRDAKKVKKVNMYKEGKPVRNAAGDIIKAAAYQSKEVPKARVEPNRRWFGNTRVIAQDALAEFRQRIGAKICTLPFPLGCPLFSGCCFLFVIVDCLRTGLMSSGSLSVFDETE
jgi:hypothetical protein